MRADALKNREKIVATADQMLQENGAQLSLDTLAKRVGVGAGTLYRHFPNRKDLIAAVLIERQEKLPTVEELLATTPNAATALRIWLEALLKWIHSYNKLAEPLLEASEARESPLGVQCFAAISSIDRLLKAAKAEGAIRQGVNSFTIYKAVLGIAWASWGEDDPKQYLRLLEQGWAS